MVFVFNEHRILTSIMKSLYSASQVFRISAQTISLCCTGKRISSNGYYFRHSDPNVRIDLYEDMDNLMLEEYDELCGVSRRYHSTGEMKKRKQKSGRVKRTNNKIKEKRP
jgi:hypothetical protein